MLDAVQYLVSVRWDGGWEKLLEVTRIYAYRGRFSGFVAVSSAGACKPWCGVCQRPVDRCTVEETLNVLRVKALLPRAHGGGGDALRLREEWAALRTGPGLLERAAAALRDMMGAVHPGGLDFPKGRVGPW